MHVRLSFQAAEALLRVMLTVCAIAAFLVQLIGDQQRGFAWSRALLGLPANTIHVCGDTSALALIRHLAGLCGDDFEVHSYER